MGCLFGAHLGQVCPVTLIGRWPEQLRALGEGPLQLKYPDGRDEFVHLKATFALDEVAPADVALILTKSAGTEQAARAAKHVLKRDGIALTLQNGLGNLDILARHLGTGRTSLGVTMQGAAMEAAGRLRVGGSGPTTLATRPRIHEQMQQLATLMQAAGLDAFLSDDVRGLVWGKLAVNAGINPLSALLRVPNGLLARSTWARGMMREAATEVAVVAVAQGIQLPFASAADEAQKVAHLTADNRSSMLQDIERGAVTEIETISGAVLRKGAELGVPTPVNAMLYGLVKALEDAHS
jgi:2-dehydropantoate 2-reductase